MNKLHYLLIICLLFSSCTAFSPEPLPTSSPFPTPTLDIENINLDSILIQDGDLPAGYKPAQITYSGIPFLESKNNLASNWIRQDIAYKDDDIGGITLGLSKTKEESQQIYESLVESFGKEEVNESGVQSKFGNSKTSNGTEIEFCSVSVDFSEYGIPNIETISIAFHKCFFTGYITLTNTDEPEEMINYIERLSRRLAVLIQCE